MNWYDKACEELESQLDRGEINNQEFREAMRELNSDLRGEAEIAAEEAYNDILGGWWP